MEGIYLILLFTFLGLSAFIVALETAFLAVQKSRVKHLMASGRAGAVEVEAISLRPDRLLATTLFINNLVQTAAAALGTVIAVSLLGQGWGLLAATVVISLATLLFAEAVPKTFAARNAERVALLFARPFRALEASLSPIVSGISWLTSRLSGGPMVAPHYQVSEEEIRSIITVGEQAGAVAQPEAQMLHQVLEFRKRPAREVMTPRPDIVAIEKESPVARLLETYAQAPYSRFPVYEGSLDNMVGLVSVKDVLLGQAQGNLTPEHPIAPLLRPLMLVPEGKPLGQLFGEMQASGYPMAIVVDEYGSVAGLVTGGQLVEEIVGKMRDELAPEGEEVSTIGENTFELDGSLRVEEANEQLKLGIPEGDYETVAGFALNRLGHIPREGEQFKYNGWKVVVVQVKGLRIEKLLISKE